MIFKSFLNVLFALNVLNVINATESDVRFDINKYFKVNIATNKPTTLSVTLYNPHIWPGPNDTHSTSTTTPLPTTQKRRFVFGLRRSVDNFNKRDNRDNRDKMNINRGYGYDANTSQHINNPPIEPIVSPFNRKFYNLDFNRVINNFTTDYPQNIQEFRGFRNISRNNHIPRNYSERFPVNPNLSRYVPESNTRIVRRRFPILRNISTTKKPTQWQIFPTNTPRFNFSRDLGDFQDIIKTDFSRWKNTSGNFNDYSAVNQTKDKSFSCNQMRFFGYYADIESNCKFFHVCTPDGRKVSFVCPHKLRFNQMLTVCDWSRNVNCRQSSQYYELNLIKFDHWNRQPFI